MALPAKRCLFVLLLLLLWSGASVAVASALPDLTVQTFAPPSGTVERTFAISSAVRNVGTSPSGVFTVVFVLSSDTDHAQGHPDSAPASIRSLNPGATSQELSTNVTVPASVPAGSYYLFMVVDPENEVAESDETNNFRADPDPVRILADQPPDIGSWAFFMYPGPVARTFTVDAEVRNYGTGPTGPFAVGLYLSGDTTFTTADTLIGEEQVGDIAAGATEYVGQFITVPASVPAGVYYLGMIMDTQNAVAETNEANNVAYRPDQVVISDLPDLATWDFAPPRGAVERNFVIGNSVKNYGRTSAGPFTTGFYLSTDMVVTTADTLIGTRSFANLPTGATSPHEDTTVTVPGTVPVGRTTSG